MALYESISKKAWQGNNVMAITENKNYVSNPWESHGPSNIKRIDLNPNVRVFIYGVEITDIMSVSSSMTVDTSCNALSVTIFNPHKRYMITEQDLSKNWRTDKLITRKIFETKFYSGIDIVQEQPVFGTGDPIRVFMKGRFSQFFYPAFTGFVTDWNSDDKFGNTTTLTLTCKDWMWRLEKSYININPAMNNEARSIYRSAVTTHSDQVNLNLFSNPIAGYTSNPNENSFKAIFTNLILGTDDNELIQLADEVCRFWTPQIKKTNEEIDKIQIKIDALKNKLLIVQYQTIVVPDISTVGIQTEIDILVNKQDELKAIVLDMTTKKVNAMMKIGTNGKRVTGVGSLNYCDQLTLSKDKLTPQQVQETLQDIQRIFPIAYDLVKTDTGYGWIVKDTITIQGYHPAMTNDHVSQFGKLLDSIHTLALTDKWKSTSESPHMKMMEQNDGINDLCYLYNKDTVKNRGSGNNVIGPRLFVIMPDNIYNNFKHPVTSGIKQFTVNGNNFKSRLSILGDISNALRYNFYCTGFGDLILEPWWNDTRPEDWDDNISTRDGYVRQITDTLDLTETVTTTRMTAQGNTVTETFGTKAAGSTTIQPTMGIGKNIQDYTSKTSGGYSSYKIGYYGGDTQSPLVIQRKDEKGINTNFRGDLVYTEVSVNGNNNNPSEMNVDVGSEIEKWNQYSQSPTATNAEWIADGFKQYLTQNDNTGDVGSFDQAQLVLDEIKQNFKTYDGIEELIQKGIYIPQWDLAKLYGYKSLQTLHLRFVTDKKSANLMVKLIFLEALLDSYTVTIDTLYRPECILNRPYYIESVQCIGLMSSFTWTYTANQDLTWKSNFKNVRKQIFQKEYAKTTNLLSGYHVDPLDINFVKDNPLFNKIQAFETIGSLLDINIAEDIGVNKEV